MGGAVYETGGDLIATGRASYRMFVPSRVKFAAIAMINNGLSDGADGVTTRLKPL